jgi:hypothetical protein
MKEKDDASDKCSGDAVTGYGNFGVLGYARDWME